MEKRTGCVSRGPGTVRSARSSGEFGRTYPRYRHAAGPVNRPAARIPRYLVKYQSSGFRPNWVSVSNEEGGPEMLVRQA